MTDNINDINENEVAPEQPTEETPVKGMKDKDVTTVSKKQTVMKVFVQIGLYAFLVLMALIVLFPFYWMLIYSVKSVE